jgi:hypothetical protein
MAIHVFRAFCSESWTRSEACFSDPAVESEAAEASGPVAHVRAIDPQKSVAVFSQVASNVSAPVFSCFVLFMIHLARLNLIVLHLSRKSKKVRSRYNDVYASVNIDNLVKSQKSQILIS